jgi:nicotinamidase-related amidase
MSKLNLDTASTALLLMDCQEGIVGALNPDQRSALMTSLQQARTAARNSGIPIIYVVIGFRDGHQEIGEKGWFTSIKESRRMILGSQEAAICIELSPLPGDLIVTKKRMSGFTGSDLEQILRGLSIQTLVLCGVSSVGVVESTARHAIDMDYNIIILKDGCADRDELANDAALTHVLPRIATVIDSETFLDAINITPES